MLFNSGAHSVVMFPSSSSSSTSACLPDAIRSSLPATSTTASPPCGYLPSPYYPGTTHHAQPTPHPANYDYMYTHNMDMWHHPNPYNALHLYNTGARGYDDWPHLDQGHPGVMASPAGTTFDNKLAPTATAETVTKEEQSPIQNEYKLFHGREGEDLGPLLHAPSHSPSGSNNAPRSPTISTDNNQHLTNENNNPSRSPFEWINKRPGFANKNGSGERVKEGMEPIGGRTRTKDKYRVVYSDHQRLELEKEFHYSRYITIRRKSELAQALNLSERQVKIWFQNRRAKERKHLKKRDELIHKEKLDAAASLHAAAAAAAAHQPATHMFGHMLHHGMM